MKTKNWKKRKKRR